MKKLFLTTLIAIGSLNAGAYDYITSSTYGNSTYTYGSIAGKSVSLNSSTYGNQSSTYGSIGTTSISGNSNTYGNSTRSSWYID